VQVRDAPNYDAVCFHAQQCAEKYLKARLLEANVGFPKTHDLGALLTLLGPIEPAWEWLRRDIVGLSALAVEIRYPGRSPDADDAREAMRIAGEVRRLARNALGLER
jgi:HEPN domain-containing protein